jgi:hypothetical protein
VRAAPLGSGGSCLCVDNCLRRRRGDGGGGLGVCHLPSCLLSRAFAASPCRGRGRGGGGGGNWEDDGAGGRRRGGPRLGAVRHAAGRGGGGEDRRANRQRERDAGAWWEG